MSRWKCKFNILSSVIQCVDEHRLKKRKTPENARQVVSGSSFPWKAVERRGWPFADNMGPVVSWSAQPGTGACVAHLGNIRFQGGPSAGNQGLISPRLRGKNFQKREKSNYYISMQIKIHRPVAGSQRNYFRSALPSAWPVNCREIQANRFFCD